MSQIRRQSPSEVATRYERRRTLARQVAQDELSIRDRETIRFEGITPKDCLTAESWSDASNYKTNWDWSWATHFNGWIAKNPKYFDLAIWHRHELCGLSLGRPSYSGNILSLEFVEGAPENNPLKGRIAALVVKAAQEYADVIGATRLKFANPVNERVRSIYTETLGFNYEANGNFCWRDL